MVCITLPPLRERRDEIPVLTEPFLRQYSRALQQAAAGAGADTLRLFAEYDWPGNVRELENLIKRMVILGTDESIRRELADAIAGRTLRAGPIPALQPRRRPGRAPVAAAAPARRGAGAAVDAPPPVPTGSLKDIARTPRAKRSAS